MEGLVNFLFYGGGVFAAIWLVLEFVKHVDEVTRDD